MILIANPHSRVSHTINSPKAQNQTAQTNHLLSFEGRIWNIPSAGCFFKIFYYDFCLFTECWLICTKVRYNPSYDRGALFFLRQRAPLQNNYDRRPICRQDYTFLALHRGIISAVGAFGGHDHRLQDKVNKHRRQSGQIIHLGYCGPGKVPFCSIDILQRLSGRYGGLRPY